MYRIRFHLGAGKHFRHWRIQGRGEKPQFIPPVAARLRLQNCRLVLRRSTAEKICDGAAKQVCAWIEAEGVVVWPGSIPPNAAKLEFNPRTCPQWRINGQPVNHRDVQGAIFVDNTNLYYLEKPT